MNNLFTIYKMRDDQTISFAADELKKYLWTMMPKSGNTPISLDPKATEGFRLGLLEDFGLEKDGYFLFLGRLVPEKGVHYLVDAFLQTQTDKKLVIAGGTSGTDDYIEQLKRKAAGDERILFTGFVQGQRLEELYSNAYTYVLPSDVEGMPLSLLEAMSYGNCCLTSTIPECTEVVEDHAVAFQKGDVADLARTLQRLCDEPQTVAGYQAGARDFICEKYNWDLVASQTMELYHENFADQQVSVP